MTDFHGYNDTMLFNCVRKGNARAFSEFFARYWPPMFLHALRMLRDEDSCQDALQEVFLDFWRRAPELPEDTCVEAYLYRMIRNRILKIIAGEKQRAELLDNFMRTSGTLEATADAGIREAELVKIINNELDKMPPRMREVYDLSRNKNLNHREIAERLGISVNTVKVQLNNALQRIKKRISIHFLLLYFSHLLLFP